MYPCSLPNGASDDAWFPVPVRRFSVPPGNPAVAAVYSVVPVGPTAASRSATVAKLTGTFRFSPVDSNDKPIEAKPVRIALRPGCRLELEFARDGDRAAGDGEYTLQGDFGEGLFFGLVKPQMKASGTIKDGIKIVRQTPLRGLEEHVEEGRFVVPEAK